MIMAMEMGMMMPNHNNSDDDNDDELDGEQDLI